MSALIDVCVYCGSSLGRRPEYVEAARELGRALVHRGLGLVYGGARVGIMGVLADSVLAEGGRVTGVMPRALVDKEIAHEGLTELVITTSMHERKMTMAQRASAFVALPGGLGTLEELFEVLTWAQLGLHDKPCGILNVARYYEGLVAFLDHAVAEGYVRAAHRDFLVVESEPAALLDRLARHATPRVEKWVRPEET